MPKVLYSSIDVCAPVCIKDIVKYICLKDTKIVKYILKDTIRW